LAIGCLWLLSRGVLRVESGFVALPKNQTTTWHLESSLGVYPPIVPLLKHAYWREIPLKALLFHPCAGKYLFAFPAVGIPE
jgi:hypothetical protein